VAEGTTPGERFWYDGEILRIVDGDTIEVRLDLGCSTYRREKLRVYGINAPESRGATAAAGKAAKAFLEGLLPVGTHALVHTIKDKDEKFGRLLANLFLPTTETGVFDTITVSQRMIDAGHAVPYFGGKRE
jgi:micrococcal nuclease